MADANEQQTRFTAQATIPKPQLVTESSPTEMDYADHRQVRARLDDVRRGKEWIGGKEHSRPSHLVNRDVYKIALGHFLARGSFMLADVPMYFDRQAGKLIVVAKGDPDLSAMLRRIGLLAGEAHTAIVENTIINLAAVSEKYDLHRLSLMTDDTIYINAGEGRMAKVTEDKIEFVSIGTDGVILHDPEVMAWPDTDDLLKLVEDMRPQVGTTCTQLRRDLPLSQHLTTRWSTDSRITPEQAHQIFVTRFLFSLTAASRVTLWPVRLITGEQGSGKSTAMELELTLVYGTITQGQAIPSANDKLQLTAAASSILALDNIDGAHLDAPRKADMADTLCIIATGGKVKLRRLYTTSSMNSLNLRTHLMMTSRAWPLDRDDLLRRTLRLEVEPAHDAELVSKDDLFAALLAARPHILAEILLRAQNILRAMKQPDKAFRRHSEMYEYEKWTYRLGAYEGTLVETETTWQAIREQAKATLTESSAIVQAMRLVIGKRGSCIDRLSIAELFGLMQTAHADAGQQLIYRAANKLGMHLSNSGPSLDTIGVRHRRDGKSAYVVAQPSQAEIDRCVAMFNALRREQLARQAPWLAMVPEHAKTARPTIPESVDDFSDMPS